MTTPLIHHSAYASIRRSSSPIARGRRLVSVRKRITPATCAHQGTTPLSPQEFMLRRVMATLPSFLRYAMGSGHVSNSMSENMKGSIQKQSSKSGLRPIRLHITQRFPPVFSRNFSRSLSGLLLPFILLAIIFLPEIL